MNGVTYSIVTKNYHQLCSSSELFNLFFFLHHIETNKIRFYEAAEKVWQSITREETQHLLMSVASRLQLLMANDLFKVTFRGVIISDFYCTIIVVKIIKDNDIMAIFLENLCKTIHLKLFLLCVLSLFGKCITLK